MYAKLSLSPPGYSQSIETVALCLALESAEAGKELEALEEEMHEMQIPQPTERSISFKDACETRDYRLIKLFLDRLLTFVWHMQPEYPRCVEVYKQLHSYAVQVFPPDPPMPHAHTSAITSLAQSIFEAASVFNPKYPTGLDQLTCLHTACFLDETQKPREWTYFNREKSKLPISIHMNAETAFLLFRRTLIGGGKFKIVYPAVEINLAQSKVEKLAVVYFPSKDKSLFDPRVVKWIERMKPSKHFPQMLYRGTYFSNSQDRGREICIMEYLKGGDLKKLINSNPDLPVDTMISISKGLANGINELHSQGILHCDIRDENCLWDGVDRGCLNDFDLAEDEGSEYLWHALYPSARYTAPEVVEAVIHPNAISRAAEMYALGATLHCVFIGYPSWFVYFTQYMAELKRYIDEPVEEYPKYVKEIKATSEDRKNILKEQNQIQEKLRELEAVESPTKEQRFFKIVYSLLHPDPNKRLTAAQFLEQITALAAPTAEKGLQQCKEDA